METLIEKQNDYREVMIDLYMAGIELEWLEQKIDCVNRRIQLLEDQKESLREEIYEMGGEDYD